MLNLVLVGLAALLGGGLSSLGLLAVWVLSAGSSGGEGGAAHAKTGKLGRRQSGDEASSEGGWSEISTGAPDQDAGSVACPSKLLGRVSVQYCQPGSVHAKVALKGLWPLQAHKLIPFWQCDFVKIGTGTAMADMLTCCGECHRCSRLWRAARGREGVRAARVQGSWRRQRPRRTGSWRAWGAARERRWRPA